MSYSRRVLSWLFSLPALLVQVCARGADLEMISVWLLFLKLLRATTGVKRPNGSETDDGRKESLNQQQKEQENLSEAVTMETSQHSEMVDLKDYKMDLQDTEEENRHQSEEDERDCLDAYFPQRLDTEKSSSPIMDELRNCSTANDRASSEETDRSKNLQEDIMVQESNLGESTPSPEPETHHQDQPGDKDEDNNPSLLDDGGMQHQEEKENTKIEQEDNSSTLNANGNECQDLHGSPEREQEGTDPFVLDTNWTEHKESQEYLKIEQEVNHTSTLNAKREECQELQASPETNQEANPADFDTNLTTHEELQEHLKMNQEDNNSSNLNAKREECQDLQASSEREQEVINPSALDTNWTEHKESQEGLKTEQKDIMPSAFLSEDLQQEPKIQQESALEQQINELAVSDASTESCPDNDGDDLSDCLQVEMAIVSSDSDADEQWKSMFSPVVDQDETVDDPGPPDVAHEDIFDEDSKTQFEANTELKNEDVTQTINNTDILKQPECPTECELDDVSYEASIHYQSLTKIPEDQEDLSQKAKHSLQRLSASTSELDKKLPQDYCVIQEMKSANVSTEHVDFRMARQQWQKMEEKTKSQLYQPTTKQGICQSSHNLMYTPVRNLERPKRDQDSDSLSLGDLQYTQFSPCSEDSGLDDISYRSPSDEPETPVEREIRETIQREETFKRERAMSRPPSGEPAQGKHRPSTLLTSRSDPEERKRMYNTPEDRCRSQRSPSARTPTFSITASPSSRPTYHEMVANNVIILEPDSYPASPRHRGKGLLSPGTNRFHEWPSDMSNVIILETSNLIIRSASEFCLSTCQETQESTFHKNPFFKLRSHSTQSLVDQEIKVVRQREEEFRRQRAQLYTKEKYDTVLVSPNLLDSFTYDRAAGEMPAKCKSSPSSPSKIRKMDRSVLSCDQKFPEAPYTGVRRKSALVQRWEAGIFANHQQD